MRFHWIKDRNASNVEVVRSTSTMFGFVQPPFFLRGILQDRSRSSLCYSRPPPKGKKLEPKLKNAISGCTCLRIMKSFSVDATSELTRDYQKIEVVGYLPQQIRDVKFHAIHRTGEIQPWSFADISRRVSSESDIGAFCISHGF